MSCISFFRYAMSSFVVVSRAYTQFPGSRDVSLMLLCVCLSWVLRLFLTSPNHLSMRCYLLLFFLSSFSLFATCTRVRACVRACTRVSVLTVGMIEILRELFFDFTRRKAQMHHPHTILSKSKTEWIFVLIHKTWRQGFLISAIRSKICLFIAEIFLSF